jgi:hypothetical protein
MRGVRAVRVGLVERTPTALERTPEDDQTLRSILVHFSVLSTIYPSAGAPSRLHVEIVPQPTRGRKLSTSSYVERAKSCWWEVGTGIVDKSVSLFCFSKLIGNDNGGCTSTAYFEQD